METRGSKYVQGMYRIADQWPYLRYLGMGAWWAWIWLCYSATGLFPLSETGSFARRVGEMYLYSTPAIMAALIAAALVWRRVTPLLSRRGFVLGLSALATVGCAAISASPLAGAVAGAAFGLGAVLTGLGTSVLALKTGQVYGTLGRNEVLSVGSAALIVAALLYFMGIGLPSAWQPVYIALMPLLSAALFVMPGDDPFPADDSAARVLGRRTPGMRSYVHLVVAAAVVAATAGFAKGIATAAGADVDYAQTGAISTFFIALAALAICIAVNSGDIVRAVRRVYAALMFFGVAVVLLSAFGTSLMYTAVGKELLWMVFTCLMAYMSFRFGFSAVRAFGFGQAAYFAASSVAWWFGTLCAPYTGNQSVYLVIVVAMVLAIVVVCVFVFTDADIKFIFTWKRAGAEMPAAAADGSERGIPTAEGAAIRAVAGAGEAVAAGAGTDVGPASVVPNGLGVRIAAIPERYGVSAREAEVMGLFALGHSANWIAEDLVISKNTVRSHIRSIYTKLDVHSRRELLDFLATVEV